MAENKIFAGPKIRRLRTAQGLTQTAMAEALGISPSYLNLIERNQRPLTVQLILKLASSYKINLDELQGANDHALQLQVDDVFADPLLAGEVPERTELFEFIDSAPNAAIAMVKLHKAYRESLERLSGLTQLMAKDGGQAQFTGERLPADEIREHFERKSPYIPAIERGAESILGEFTDQGDLDANMREWLLRKHNISVQIVPPDVMPNLRKRFDRHTNRILVSERLSPCDQTQEIAVEIALLAQGNLLSEEVGFMKLNSDEAKRLARFEFARLTALAMMMPYEPVLRAARRVRFDINILRARFGVTFAQMAWRLLMLQRQGQSAPRFFAMEVDIAGNQIRRSGSGGFPLTHIGNCPKLVVHQAFNTPGRVAAERVVTTRGQHFVVIGRTVEGLRSGFLDRPQRTAMLIGFSMEDSSEVIYADGLESLDEKQVVEIGPSCRLCERPGCIARAQPPITRPLGLDDMAHGLSVFDFQ